MEVFLCEGGVSKGRSALAISYGLGCVTSTCLLSPASLDPSEPVTPFKIKQRKKWDGVTA